MRNISEAQRKVSLQSLKKYRLELGAKNVRFEVAIDLNTGFTIQLINQIVAKCEFLTFPEQVMKTFPIWDKDRAV